MAEEFVTLTMTPKIRRAVFLDIVYDWLDQHLQASGEQIVSVAEMSDSDTSLKINTPIIVSGRWTSFITKTQSYMVPVHMALDGAAITPTTLEVGQTILVNKVEPMSIESIDGPDGDGKWSISVSRGAKVFAIDDNQPGVPPRTHPAGSSVWVLRYATPFRMFRQEVFMPWVETKVRSRGSASATLHGDI